VNATVARDVSPIVPAARSSSLRRRFFVAAVGTILAANVVGIITALIQNVPTPPDGDLARDTWIFMGTTYSAPLVLVVLCAVGLALSGRRGLTRVIGTALPMVVAALGDLSLTSDWPGVSDAIAHHFNPVGFAAIWTLILVNPLVVLAGALLLWSRRPSAGEG
jgi:hypothetical protein